MPCSDGSSETRRGAARRLHWPSSVPPDSSPSGARRRRRSTPTTRRGREQRTAIGPQKRQESSDPAALECPPVRQRGCSTAGGPLEFENLPRPTVLGGRSTVGHGALDAVIGGR